MRNWDRRKKKNKTGWISKANKRWCKVKQKRAT